MTIRISKLPSGYWHIRGQGPSNWAQCLVLPETMEEVRKVAYDASDDFCYEVAKVVRQLLRRDRVEGE